MLLFFFLFLSFFFSFLPYTVQNIAIRKDSDVEVWLNNVVKLTVFLVPKKGVGHPDFPGVRQSEVFDTTWKKIAGERNAIKGK